MVAIAAERAGVQGLAIFNWLATAAFGLAIAYGGFSGFKDIIDATEVATPDLLLKGIVEIIGTAIIADVGMFGGKHVWPRSHQ